MIQVLVVNYLLLLTGFIQCAICGPMELAKIKLQAQGEGQKAGTRGSYTGAIDCLKKIYKIEGTRGLCRGSLYIAILYLRHKTFAKLLC